MEESRIKKAVDSLINQVIIFLRGESQEQPDKLFTREEKDELGYSVRKQIERGRYKERDSE